MNNDNHKSFIHNLKIATPCPAEWNTMTGDERKRFCGQCKLNVYNISAMTLDEAETLINEAEGRICIRMFRRKDGTVITEDCPVGIAAKFKRRMKLAGAYIVAAITVCGAIAQGVVSWRQAPKAVQTEARTIIHTARMEVKGEVEYQPEHHVLTGDVYVPPKQKSIQHEF